MNEKVRKKHDIIKEKNKLKVSEKFRLFEYARWISLITALLVLVMFFFSTGFTTENMNRMFTEQPMIIVGFLICIIDLLIWAQMAHLLTYLKTLEHIETVRIQLLSIAISQIVCFNYISFLCIVVGLWKYYRWDQFHLVQSIKEIKKDGQWKNTLSLTLILWIASALSLFLVFVFQAI